MRKLIVALSALAALGLALPYAANADTVIIHKHRHGVYDVVPPPPVPHHHDNKTVIIKHND